MARARMVYDWTHTASVLALTANCHRDPKSAQFQPRDFHPFTPPRRQMAPITALKDIFIKHARSK